MQSSERVQRIHSWGWGAGGGVGTRLRYSVESAVGKKNCIGRLLLQIQNNCNMQTSVVSC